jgi:hypothetical protein
MDYKTTFLISIAVNLVKVEQNGTIIKHHNNPLSKDDTNFCQKEDTFYLKLLRQCETHYSDHNRDNVKHTTQTITEHHTRGCQCQPIFAIKIR